MIGTTLLVMGTVAAAVATTFAVRRRPQVADVPSASGVMSAVQAMAVAPPRPGAAPPVRSVNPKLLGKDTGVWELKASPKCEFARALHGKRFEAADTLALPLAGCNPMTCTCIYVQVREARRGVRRRGDERREELRFDLEKKERRAKDRRRARSIWDGKA